MKRLYTVTIEVTAVVAADSETDAAIVAADRAREIVRDSSDLVPHVVGELTREAQLPETWNMLCLPYGGRADKYIYEYLKANNQEPA